MDRFLIAFRVIFLAVSLDTGDSRDQMCYGNLSTLKECKGVFFQQVCLICNVSRNATNVRWYLNNQQLTQNEFNFDEFHAGGMEVNQCHSEKYSLRLTSPSKENHNQLYICVDNGETVSRFTLKLKASTLLFINSTNIFDGKLLVNEEHPVKKLQCVIDGAVPPFSLTWSLNGVVQESRTINYSTDTFSFDLLYDISHVKTHSVVTCSSVGPYVKSYNTSLELYVIETDVKSENDLPLTKETNSLINLKWILVASGSAIVFVIVVLSIGKGIQTYQLSKRDRFIQGAFVGNQGEDVEATSDPYHYVEEFANRTHSYSEQINNTLATCLDSKISVHGLYEYWTGTYTIDGTVQGNCLAKQLSDQGTLQEASEFKLLAKKLLALKKSAYVVSLLAINIAMEPFSIVYEFLEYGSLRDFVMTRYQQPHSKDEVRMSLKEQVKELLTFAVNVAQAMAFIESQKFCHPFVSLRKVLLTSQCGCKLYDIRPNDMAMIKVKEALKKNNPPIAWMPPETIFLCEYTPACDGWSFSVLLWELFSLGDTPYAGNTNAEIENMIREGNLLPQPTNCPGSVYETMFLSWQKIVEKRPSFAVLYRKLEDILKATQGADDTKGKIYLTLNRNESGDYI
ncbi:Muscle, skeletal receptor tyrosine-protein kinase [Holothuria leucospilota]|uniref:Muscle, skeletal receptor tyrosine-protein kinase n=1 Tax=Holothuria leucospilota TaxID=206669 RepID=A0A9Q1BXU8_HOLLE|nr:Muscle, skeletal receptor tyrosine-protein kinase [Holothuria leucospilota]